MGRGNRSHGADPGRRGQGDIGKGAADIADYSRMTGEDEIGTHRDVMVALDYTSNATKEYHGTVLRYAGDAILAELLRQMPGLTLSATRQQVPWENPQHSARYLEGLREAGLPG